MEPGVEIFVPARVYARVGWATLAGSLLCVLAAFREPLTLIPALAFACAAAALFWLAARPPLSGPPAAPPAGLRPPRRDGGGPRPARALPRLRDRAHRRAGVHRAAHRR